MHISSSWLSFIGSLLTVATVTVVANSFVAAATLKTTQNFPQTGIVAVRQMGSTLRIDKEGNGDRLPSDQQNMSDCGERSPRPCSPGGSR